MSNKAVNALFLIFSQAVNVVILFLFTPYLVRALPKQVYGTYGQVLFITEFVSILTSIAIIQTAMVFFSDTTKKFEDSLKTVLGFTFFAGMVAFIVLLVFSFFAPDIFSNQSLGSLLRVYAFSLLGSKLNLVLNQAMIKIQGSKFLMVLSVLSNLLKLSLAIIAIQVYQSISTLLIIYALEPLLTGLIQIYKLQKEGYWHGKFNMNTLKEIFKVGFPLYIVDILGSSYTYIAGFIIGIYLNEEQYALYRNGSVELPVIGTIYGTISLIFMADFSKHILERNFTKVAEIKKQIITTTSVILFPIAIFFIFFSKEFILLYLTDKYYESFKIFALFSCVLLIRFQNYTDILVLLKKSRYVLLGFVIFMIANFGLNIVLSKNFGIIGCAIATVFSVYLLAFFQLHMTIKQLGVRYNQYINFKALGLIIGISFLVIGIFKLTMMGLEIPILWSFIISGVITVPTLIIFFIKKKLVDIHHYKSIFVKVPFIGNKMFELLS